MQAFFSKGVTTKRGEHFSANEVKSVTTRGCSSVGRAPALQAGGQEFESLHLHAKHELCTNERTRRRRACMKAFECVHPYRATLVTK